MKCRICKIESAMNTYRGVYGQVSKVPECYNCNSLTNEEAYRRMNHKYHKDIDEDIDNATDEVSYEKAMSKLLNKSDWRKYEKEK